MREKNNMIPSPAHQVSHLHKKITFSDGTIAVVKVPKVTDAKWVYSVMPTAVKIENIAHELLSQHLKMQADEHVFEIFLRMQDDALRWVQTYAPRVQQFHTII